MPYKIRKNRNKNTYKVYNTESGKVFAKAATLKNAEAQVRLLYMMERKRFG
jgi:hypothetical protein